MSKWISGLLFGAAALLAAACAPLVETTPVVPDQADTVADITVSVSDQSQIEAEQTDGVTMLDVISDSGIGKAAVTWRADDAAPLLLRLHLNGLEEFRFTYDTTKVQASVASSGDHQISQSLVGENGSQEPITPQSPHWFTIEPKTTDGEPATSIPLAGGYFDITPPADFVDNPSDAFTFSWIDFYR